MNQQVASVKVADPAGAHADAEVKTEADADVPGFPAIDETLVLDDFLVEDVSIDGMCGVY